jgi:uncharacterized protein
MNYPKKMTVFFLLLLSVFSVEASVHKVVFELTSDDPKIWETLINNVENVKKELGPKTQIEVVTHGNGLGLLLKTNTALKERISKQTSEGVKYLACENTMKRKNVSRSDLFEFVGTVPAGLAEIIRKQKEGWAYVKIGH